MGIKEETDKATKPEPIFICGLSKQGRRRKKEAENSNGKRRKNANLLSEAKLGNDEEEVSLSMRMGSMVAVAVAPAGGGTVDGLVEDARLPMLAAGRCALRRRAGEEEDEVW